MEGVLDNYSHILKHLQAVQCNGNVAEKEKIRNFVSFLQRSKKEIMHLNSSRNSDLVKLILEVLVSGILHHDNQVLLSTALCLLMKVAFEDEACDEILGECIACESESLQLLPLLPFSSSPPGTVIVIKDAVFFRVCLSWSILQCFGVESLKKFYISTSERVKEKKLSPFIFVFGLLKEQCNSFSSVTFISFKTIPVWLNRMGELFARRLIEEASLIFYLNDALCVVSRNWENSVAGVREKNVEILRTVFNILPKTSPIATLPNNLLNLPYFLEIVMSEVPWRMKCKYLMLTSLLQKFGVKEGLIKFPDIPSGLVYSLSSPHLVSAGADSYRELIQEITMDQWMSSFYFLLKTVMTGEDRVAQDNLMSYWMPDTLKVFPMAIDEMLPDLLCGVKSSSLFSVLALYRIGRKFGLLKWQQMDCELLKRCASHLREDVRGETFMVVCLSSKMTLLPTPDEMEMVSLFLVENVNVDSAKLRQVSTTSFKVFVCRLKDAYCSLCSEKESTDEGNKIMGFFNWLLKFIMDNFLPGANYQRRITSLHLLRIILDNICHEVSGTSNPREKKRREYIQGERWLRNELGRTFKGRDVFNILLRCVMDSVSDIRDAASNILKIHFESPSGDLFQKLWKKALSMCSSSMFYEIESGAVLAECLICWNLCKGNNSMIIPYVEVLLSHAEEQKANLEDNLLRGAMSTPVHGILNCLYRIFSNPDILTQLKLEEPHAKKLINLVDSLINFALGVLSSKPDSEMDVAPSFAEMGIAIECAISKNVKCLDGADVGGLSGAPELVLNCIWLNLKVCCLVVSALATNLSCAECGPLMKECDVEYCGQLLMRVLMKCRHKGAIESAGKSLSSFASFCASSPNPKLRELPLKMLSECLVQTIGRKDGRASITRRSAGLSILLHRLLTADCKNTVPMCIPKLISWAEMDCLLEFCNVETEDLPQTQSLHFLRAIVQDSAVYQYVSPYMCGITLVCFKNFSSRIWAIRNAALQLFGAVVPKLAGQKRGQEEDIVGSNITVEELNAHYPALLDYLLKELEGSLGHFSQDSADSSPTLLPILMLCSRLTVGLPQLHTHSFTQRLLDFQFQFYQLLSSPNIAVRKSCAKAISAFTPLTEVFRKTKALINDLTNGHPIPENELHGKLLCIKTLRDRLEVDCYLLEEQRIHFEEIQRLVESIRITGKMESKCYFTRALLCEIQGFTTFDVHTVLRTVKYASHCSHPIGILLWAAASLECTILTSSDDNVCIIMQGCFQSSDYLLEAGLQSLSKRLKQSTLSEGTNSKLLLFLDNVCNTHTSINVILHCLNTMLQLCSKSPVTLSLQQTEDLFQKFVANSNYGIVCSSVALAVISCSIGRCEDSRNARLMVTKAVTAIHEQSLPSNLEEIRLQTASTLMCFLPLIHSYQKALQDKEKLQDLINGELFSSLLNSAILLLQDEDVEVRTVAATFISSAVVKEVNSSYAKDSFNPLKCMLFLMTQIELFLPLKNAVRFLWEHLSNAVKPDALKEFSQLHCLRNPFNHGIENVFSEKVVITKCAGDSLRCIIMCGKYRMEDIKNSLLDNISYVLETATIFLSLLTMDELGDKLHAHSEIYRTFISVKYQLEIASLLGIGSAEEMQSIVPRLERGILNIFGEIGFN